MAWIALPMIGIANLAMAESTTTEIAYDAAYSGDRGCSDIRLDAPGGSMEKIVAMMPVVSQTGGTCSFQTAVQMYDAWRIRHHDQSTDHLSSTIPLAYEMKVLSKGNDLSGGNVNPNLMHLLKIGSCRRDYFDRGTGVDFDEQIYEKLFRKFKNVKTLEEMNKYSFQLLGVRQFYAVNPKPDQGKLNLALATRDFVEFITEFMPPVCDRNERMKTTSAYQVRTKSYDRTMFGFEWHLTEPVKREIHAELDLGISDAYPIAISYCSKVLKAGKNFKEISSSGDEGCGNHASLIIGRRLNTKTGACELLLRNSWSGDHSYSKNWKHEGGTSHVWIDQNTLASAIYRTDRISARK